MNGQEKLLADLRRKVAALVPPELVEREMIKVLACAVDDVFLGAPLKYLRALGWLRVSSGIF